MLVSTTAWFGFVIRGYQPEWPLHTKCHSRMCQNVITLIVRVHTIPEWHYTCNESTILLNEHKIATIYSMTILKN